MNVFILFKIFLEVIKLAKVNEENILDKSGDTRKEPRAWCVFGLEYLMHMGPLCLLPCPSSYGILCWRGQWTVLSGHEVS